MSKEDNKDIFGYMNTLIADDSVDLSGMLSELLEAKDLLRGTEEGTKLNSDAVLAAMLLKTTKTCSPEEFVSIAVSTRITQGKEFSPDMVDEIKNHAICGYRTGIEEMKKPLLSQRNNSEYMNDITKDLTPFNSLPREFLLPVIKALTDGYSIATFPLPFAEAAAIYVLTDGYNELSNFLDFVKEQREKGEL